MLSKEQFDQLVIDVQNREVSNSFATISGLVEYAQKLQSDHTTQSLALKAAKAMQQAETERADANEQYAKRYRYIRTKERMMLETDDGEARMTTTFDCAEQFDAAIDTAIATNHATIQPLSTKE